MLNIWDLFSHVSKHWNCLISHHTVKYWHKYMSGVEIKNTVIFLCTDAYLSFDSYCLSTSNNLELNVNLHSTARRYCYWQRGRPHHQYVAQGCPRLRVWSDSPPWTLNWNALLFIIDSSQQKKISQNAVVIQKVYGTHFGTRPTILLHRATEIVSNQSLPHKI